MYCVYYVSKLCSKQQQQQIDIRERERERVCVCVCVFKQARRKKNRAKKTR